jgi:hypothetical protein
MKSWSWPCAHFHQPLSRLLASAHCCAVASATAPPVMLTTAGAAGTRSSASSFSGGTTLTPRDAHNVAHAGVTWVIGVVVVTEAHGAPAADGTAVATAGAGTTGWLGAKAPHAVTANSQQPVNAVVASPLTTSPATLAAQDGHRTPNAGLRLQPLPVGPSAWHFVNGVRANAAAERSRSRKFRQLRCTGWPLVNSIQRACVAI